MHLGYKISSEEHAPLDLVRYGAMAEEAGFSWAGISDHFHPWVDKQGHSPFVWTILGALTARTEHLLIGTWVTCPTVRIHPAIIAQAAATTASMLPGRFFLGLGSGENLNEHIFATHWPEPAVRLGMLEEAVEVIRTLWEGDMTSHRGQHYTVENARLYTLPEALPPIHMAASGEKAAELAGRVGDGMIGVAPDKETIGKFEASGGKGKPKFCEITVCWAADEAKARKTALEWWPNSLTEGGLSAELPLPSHFESATAKATEDQIAELIPCG
ncbi:MAG TPA: TIGR03557 family F420-dependent LLM class oxidoreductase, partial [Dehalococcoidia bacterium]|nr:TIGR03557 family F420-dependent LLM class oxidoreductase [Dehalococcoidia bacterium]